MQFIMVLGLSDAETKLIKNVLSVADSHGLKYAVADGEDDMQTATVVVTDTAYPEQVARWVAFRASHEAVCGIMLVDEQIPKGCYADKVLKKPIKAIEFMKALAQIDIKRRSAAGQRLTQTSGARTKVRALKLPAPDPASVPVTASAPEPELASAPAPAPAPARASASLPEPRPARGASALAPAPAPVATSRVSAENTQTPTDSFKPAWTGRVLVVDDSSTIRRQLSLILEHFGLQVETADNGELALHLIATQDFDAVLLDIVLPGADGYQICKTIRRNRARSNLPVIMLTSRSSPFDRVRGSIAGCNSYMTKPTNVKQVASVLAKYMGSDAV